MVEHTTPRNAFEFVMVASQRARQLLSGCTPRATGSDKPIRLAQIEVRRGLVETLGPADARTAAD